MSPLFHDFIILKINDLLNRTFSQGIAQKVIRGELGHVFKNKERETPHTYL